MRRLLAGFLILGATLAAPHVQARDVVYNLKNDEAMQDPAYAAQVGTDVAFFYAPQKTPAIAQTHGDYTTTQKSAITPAGDQTHCRRAFLLALANLRQTALAAGGDAVVNIVSDYKNKISASETTDECHAGTIHVGAALSGTIVKLGS